MTKVRAPLSFSLAITTAVGLIGWDQAAKITRRSKRAVRYWSESDKASLPTLDQAIALDRQFMEAGGGFAPILESYARQLDISLLDTLACREALADDIAQATQESADAISSSIHVTLPGASPTEIYHAIKETEEASGAMNRLLTRLKSFLPGNGAAQRSLGES
ncbi:hypothetical protein [Sphingobium aromaticivastans]|uniref:hypothetical protein n=1 Tax=Sphingobium aromaticivastans TaxID=1778665 RepID=UPI00301B5F42